MEALLVPLFWEVWGPSQAYYYGFPVELTASIKLEKDGYFNFNLFSHYNDNQSSKDMLISHIFFSELSSIE